MSSSINVQVNRNNNIISVGINSTGPQGFSAYETWLSLGNTGTKQDFLNLQFDEPARVLNENTRKQSEVTRIENESNRIEAENTRQQQEGLRQQEFGTNEVARQTNETIRIENEETRQEADILRGQTVEAIEQNYAPRLTTAEEQINDLDAEKVGRSKYEIQIEAILNEIEFIKSNPSQPTQPNITLKGFSLKNELNYTRETWAEWNPKGQATVVNGSLVINNNTALVAPVIQTNFKPSTKYGLLMNVPVNTRETAIGISSSASGTRPFSSTLYIYKGETGNRKIIATTQADVSKNEYAFSIMTDPGRFELKDFRIFELPVGSQIEQDFESMSVDELAVKYPYIKGDKIVSTISANRITSTKNGQVAKAYIPYVGELKSNGATYDEIIIQDGKAELFRRIGLETPTVTSVAIVGNILAGDVYLEPIDLVKGIYNNGIPVTHTDLPILTIDSIIKIDGTELDVGEAVIASNKLSFTHPDLVNGDTVSFDYFYDKEGTKGILEVTLPDNPAIPTLRGVKKSCFGVASDVHLKDITVGGDWTFSLEDYRKATYYKMGNLYHFDLVQNYSEAGRDNVAGEQEWINELTLFKNYNDTYFDGEVHFCTGNHDASPTGYGGHGLNRIVESYDDGTKTGEQVYQEITGRPLNYVFTKK